MKEDLLFYSAYQDFYKMAATSEVFKKYCMRAFGADFSQDGFSDLKQLKKLLRTVTLDKSSCVLDIGCGNGKMLEYIHNKTGAKIYGFDYSETAIESAHKRMSNIGNFMVSLIGEADYPSDKFDLITSMDTIYFAIDMVTFVAQIYNWLKKGGSFICGYQEGDVMDKTEDFNTTNLAKAFKANGYKYEAINYTKETYEMLKHKRKVILEMEEEFFINGLELWYEVVKGQTESVKVPFSEYQKNNARYIYILKK